MESNNTLAFSKSFETVIFQRGPENLWGLRSWMHQESGATKSDMWEKLLHLFAQGMISIMICQLDCLRGAFGRVHSRPPFAVTSSYWQLLATVHRVTHRSLPGASLAQAAHLALICRTTLPCSELMRTTFTFLFPIHIVGNEPE